MLTVNTYLAPSPVHGIGLFAAEDIPTGAVVWKFNRHIDKTFSKKVFLAMCQGVDQCSLRHLLNSSYRRGGRYFYLTDNARFINHSERCDNIVFSDDYTEIATRDIMAHEELLENYLHAYDTSDFFFQEMVNPDPYVYLNALSVPRYRHA